LKLYRTVSLLILLITHGVVHSKESINKQKIILHHSIHSEVLGEERAIEVYLPQGYNSVNHRYPVLYLLDGQRWFLYGVELQNIFSEYEYSPEFIVVGIRNTYPDRFSNFSSNSTKFRAFLTDDVIDFIDKSFRTTNERMLFGWELGGGFVLETLYKQPHLFDGYFASSPYPVDEETTQEFKALFKTKPALSKTLVFAEGKQESNQYISHRLNDFLKQSAPQSFTWTFQELNREKTPILAHRMSPFDTLYIGLRQYFHDYPSLEFASLIDYSRFGGMEQIEKYYQQRSQRYQLDAQMPFSGMFALLKLAMNEDNVELFDQFFNAFKESGLIENTNIGWGTRYARFYQKHEMLQKSISVYQLLLAKFPSSPKIFNGMGHSFFAFKKYKNAGDYFNKAVDIAKDQNLKSLSNYQKGLDDFLETTSK